MNPNQTTRSFRILQRLIVLMLVGLAASAKAQTNLCIESTAALIQAFHDIDGSSTEDTILKLSSGTYTLSSDLWLDYWENGDPQGNYGRLVISGGYSAGCSSQSGAPGTTTINSSDGQREIRILTRNNSISIDHLSSNDIDWVFVNEDSGVTGKHPFNFSSLHFLNTYVLLIPGSYDFTMQNSLITARPGTPNNIAIDYIDWFKTDSYAPQFTLTTSTVRGGGLRLQFLPSDDNQTPDPASVRLTGNVFESAGSEITVDGANLNASNNRYDSLSLTRGTQVANLYNIAADPLLLLARTIHEIHAPSLVP